MAPDLNALGIDEMTVDERLRLIDAIWATIPDPPPLTPAQEQELDRRLDEIDAGRATFIPYQQVKADFEARYGK